MHDESVCVRESEQVIEISGDGENAIVVGDAFAHAIRKLLFHFSISIFGFITPQSTHNDNSLFHTKHHRTDTYSLYYSILN